MASLRVVATLMIRNEEKIIVRCIESLLPHVDAFCICDTGSTDRTVATVAEFFENHPAKVPYQIDQYEWKNFGESRSRSFECCRAFARSREWDFDSVYALVLDADMKLEVGAGNSFPRHLLVSPGHSLIQRNGNLVYANTRLLRLSTNWRCTGVTHEYWDGSASQPIPAELASICDVGDGGCKDDKLPRDCKLLETGLLEEPGNVRYMFYLAQTLKDMGEYKRAIAMFRRRIKAGQWQEEVWYSMYQIAQIYEARKNYPKMEYWALKAYGLNSARNENLYLMARTFRCLSQNFKAWHYVQLGLAVPLPRETPLFLDADCYHKNLLYEKTILNYYVRPLERKAALLDLVTHCNDFGSDACYINLVHYVDKVSLAFPAIPLEFPLVPGYSASSVSVMALESGTLLANVRYVNYTIRPDGSYASPGKIDTRNFCVVLNGTDGRPVGDAVEMTVEPTTKRWADPSIQGVEDLRLFAGAAGDEDTVNKKFGFVGTSLEFSHDQRIRQVTGVYNTETNLLESIVSLRSPECLASVDCEKNWIPLEARADGLLFIYQWHPLTVVRCIATRTVPLAVDKTPRFFANVRGSSNFVQWNSATTRGVRSLVGIVHVVQHLSPRKYYHMVVRLVLDGSGTRVALHSYSLPFFFFENAIEYTLGCNLRNDLLGVIVSRNDANPWLATIDLSRLEFHAARALDN